MNIYIVMIFSAAVVISFLISFSVIRLILRSARRKGAQDYVDARKLKKEPRPRLGGVGIFIAFFATIYMIVLVIFLSRGEMPDVMVSISTATLFLYTGAIFFIFILGVMDDFFSIRPLPKLLVEIAVAVILFFIGFQIKFVSVPLGLGYLSLGIFSLPVTVLWIVGVINAINLIDGLDGLAGGIVAITSATMIVILTLGGHYTYAIILAPLLGGTLGFLPHNRYPSRIIMGDSGSLFAGVILSTIMLAIPQKASFGITLMVPLAILALPILDTFLAFTRRAIRGRNPLAADSDHIHHRFLQKGHDEAKTVNILLTISLAFSVLAVVFHTSSQKVRSLLLLVIFLIILVLLRYLEYISVKKK